MDSLFEERSRTPLEACGEFGLIELLTKEIKLKNKSSVYGVGDDAAIIDAQNRLQVVSKDLLIEGVHFDLTYAPLKHVGYKAIASNLSDIAAMNAKPEQVLVGLAVSSRFTVEAVEELYAGMYLCCDRYGVDLVGGDTTSSVSGMCISVTVLGYGDEKTIVRRNTAHANELVCVSGDLGAAYMGLLILEREKQVFLKDPQMQPDFVGYDYILERQLKPEPRADIVKLLKEKGVVPTAMMDISDGLASEIIHISKGSGLGCCLYEEKLPIDTQTYETAMEMGLVPTTVALNGGEDYELLFTIRQDDYDKIKDLKEIHVIGYMTAEEGDYALITNDQKKLALHAQGWDAYQGRNRQAEASPGNRTPHAQPEKNGKDAK